MRVLILGATGLLGHALWRRAATRPGCEAFGTCHSLRLKGLLPLDLLSAGAVAALARAVKPDAVVCAASNPFVDYCESHPDETRRLNVDATLAAAEAAAGAGAAFVFFSSDYVFDGGRGVYAEGDEPAPLNEYGRQKLAVERALAGRPGNLVLRMSALYGWELKPRNFVLQVLPRLRAGVRVRAAEDQEYHPSDAESLADGVLGLLERGAEGLLHLAGPDRLSRAAFARRVAVAFGLDPGRVEGAPAAEFEAPGRARRPLASCLDSGKATGLLGRPLKGVGEALARMAAGEDDWLGYVARLEQAPEARA